MNRTKNVIAAIGLAIGAVFGVAGSIFADPILQIVLYEISSVGLVAGCALLAVKFLKGDSDYLATGFLILAIGEAVMTAGAALGQVGGQPAFAAGMALYVPALWFISIPKHFPAWNRFTGVAASVPFSIAASQMFLGQEVASTSALPGAGYGLLTLSIIGWVVALLREK